MSNNKDKIFARYTAGKEDGRETYSRNDSLEYYYTKKHLEGIVKPTDRVLEMVVLQDIMAFITQTVLRNMLALTYSLLILNY